MRNFLTAFICLLWSLPIFPQKTGDRLLLTDDCNIYDIPSITGSVIMANANDTITILRPEDQKTGYYYVGYKDTSGYINAIRVVLTKKLENPGYRKTVDSFNREAKSLADIVSHYTKIYGKPDDSSLFTTDYHKSRTLVWFCADGKYRSVQLRFEKGAWLKESEISSDCIMR